MSKTDPLRISDYLNHIVEAIPRIEHYTANLDEVRFLQDELVQDAVIRNIEIIGEASRNIERHHVEFSAAHDDIPWRDIYLMRNQVSHGYFSVDLEIIWQTIQRDIPSLKNSINSLLQ